MANHHNALEFAIRTETDNFDYGAGGQTPGQLYSIRPTDNVSVNSEATTTTTGSGNRNCFLATLSRVWGFRSLANWCYHDDSSQGLIDSSRNPRRNLSTLSGVFAPVALAMFSAQLYVRAGFLVGQAGMLESFLQLILAYTILALTVTSICAISTNGAVEGGGVYYMISRALGPEFGGSIGFMFFIANVLGCALYISAFVEGMMENFGVGGLYASDGGLPVNGNWWRYLYASVVLLICLIVCLIGGSMFARTSAIILLLTVVCTISVFISILATNKTIDVAIPSSNHYIYPDAGSGNGTTNVTQYGKCTGLSAKTFRDNLYPDYTGDYSTDTMMDFAAVFAVLFSSVTGIMNGSNMSGELKDPSKSIPKGTLAAIVFTFITYMIETVLISGSCQRYLLVNNYIFLQDINLWPPFVLIGIFATTLSAALGNLIGASRVLEALANDQLFFFLLKPATITTKSGNPYVAVLMSWILVQLVLLIGSLNDIAPISSTFFLLAYAATNLACMALDLASAPNFRPTFKYFSWYTSLMGLVGSLVMCFLISSIYASIAVIAMLVLVILLHFRSLPTQWGSISQALIFHQVRKYLLMLDIRKSHVKYWRPQILLMVANPRHSCELMDFINDLKKGGLYVVGHVKVGHLNDFQKDPLKEEYPKWMNLVDQLKIKAFVELALTKNVSDGLHHMVRLSGLGGMKTNTVCLGFYDDAPPVDTLVRRRVKKKRFFGTVETGSVIDVSAVLGATRAESDERAVDVKEYVKMISDSLKLHKNICLCRHFDQLDKAAIFNAKGTFYIDVWPVNFFRPETASYFDNTCLFLLQLSCILNMVKGWKSVTCLRVFLFVNPQTENTLQKEHKLDAFLRQLRILAKVQIVSWDTIPLSTQLENVDMDVNYTNSHMQEFTEAKPEYLEAINRIINSFSTRTAVTFLYLPQPPVDVDQHPVYLKQLEDISNGLPPTVFVHGLHPVTSTTL